MNTLLLSCVCTQLLHSTEFLLTNPFDFLNNHVTKRIWTFDTMLRSVGRCCWQASSLVPR